MFQFCLPLSVCVSAVFASINCVCQRVRQSVLLYPASLSSALVLISFICLRFIQGDVNNPSLQKTRPPRLFHPQRLFAGFLFCCLRGALLRHLCPCSFYTPNISFLPYLPSPILPSPPHPLPSLTAPSRPIYCHQARQTLFLSTPSDNEKVVLQREFLSLTQRSKGVSFSLLPVVFTYFVFQC